MVSLNTCAPLERPNCFLGLHTQTPQNIQDDTEQPNFNRKYKICIQNLVVLYHVLYIVVSVCPDQENILAAQWRASVKGNQWSAKFVPFPLLSFPTDFYQMLQTITPKKGEIAQFLVLLGSP